MCGLHEKSLLESPRLGRHDLQRKRAILDEKMITNPKRETGNINTPSVFKYKIF
jgi:hypothetical protein